MATVSLPGAAATTGQRYPAIAMALNRLRCRSCIIDGEVVITDDLCRAILEARQGPRIKRDAVMLAFDLLELNGQDLKREPLATRKVTLLSLLQGAPSGVQYVEHIEGDAGMGSSSVARAS